MIYIITDWMNNVCFDSHDLEFPTFEDGWQFLEEKIIEVYGENYENEELEEYFVQEYREGIDRLMWNGQRYVLKTNYYEAIA